MASFSDYQQQYMEQRLGKDWGTSCGGAGAKGGRNFAEQTAFCSFIYASVRWLCDAVTAR